MAKGEWCFLDDNGLSWAETMLSLLIIFMLFGTLLPTMQKMHQTLNDKQLRAVAYETMHEAAKQVQSNGVFTGERTVNHVLFTWRYDGELCVTFENYRAEPVTVCE